MRANKVWKRKDTGWFYTKIDRKRIRLSKNRGEAEQMMHELLSERKKKAEDESLGTKAFPSFRKIADLFLENSVTENKPTTYRAHRMFLQSACDSFGKKRINDLKVHHVTAWLKEERKAQPREPKLDEKGNVKKQATARKGKKGPWGASTECSAKGTILAALNWAVDQGYISSHPLKKLKRGTHKRRERVFTADELKKIQDFVKPDFRDFLRALELTGARPFSELATLTAEMIHWDAEIIPFDEHKNEAKGKSRTIYIVPELMEILKRLAAKHPKGLLFRNSRNKIWTSHDATRRLHYATRKLGIPKGTIYAVRHKFISDGLEKGLNANVIAELCGNSSITIARHYDHVSKRKAAMLEAARKVVAVS